MLSCILFCVKTEAKQTLKSRYPSRYRTRLQSIVEVHTHFQRIVPSAFANTGIERSRLLRIPVSQYHN